MLHICLFFSGKYEDSWKYNFLGLKPSVSVPNHVKLYVLLEVKSPEPPGGGQDDYTRAPPSGNTEFKE